MVLAELMAVGFFWQSPLTTDALKFGSFYCYAVWKDPDLILMQALLLFSQKITVCNYLGPGVALNGKFSSLFWSVTDFHSINRACQSFVEPVYIHCLIVGKVSDLEITARDWRGTPASWFWVPSTFLCLSKLFS